MLRIINPAVAATNNSSSRRRKRPTTRIKLPTATSTINGLIIAAVLFVFINITVCDSLQTHPIHTYTSSSASAKSIYHNNNNYHHHHRYRRHHHHQQYRTSSSSCLRVSLHDIPFDALHSAYSSAAAHTNILLSSLPDTLDLPKSYAESIQAYSTKEFQSVTNTLD